MTQEEKELLLRDICMRLPYETMFHTEKYGEECLLSIDLEYEKVNELYGIQEIKPYLRPMSSITKDERYEYNNLCIKNGSQDTVKSIDWLNAHHFDYRGLIKLGLAIEAPKNMYKI